MKVSRRVLTRYVAKALIEGKKDITRELAAYIVENKLHGQVELILADIAVNLSSFGQVEATVTSARPLAAELKKELIAYVKRIEDAKNVTLHEEINERLIGGIIIETPNQRFDASLATKLKRLRATT